MARKARPGPRFPPTVSSSFWVSPPSAVLVARRFSGNDCARVRLARTHRPAKAAVHRSGHNRKLPLRPSVVDRLRNGLIPPRQLPDQVARIFLAGPSQNRIDLGSGLALQFNQRQADPRQNEIHRAQCVLDRSGIAFPVQNGGHSCGDRRELLRLSDFTLRPCDVQGTAKTRHYVRGEGNAAVATLGEEGECGRIVCRQQSKLRPHQ